MKREGLLAHSTEKMGGTERQAYHLVFGLAGSCLCGRSLGFDGLLRKGNSLVQENLEPLNQSLKQKGGGNVGERGVA